jgi:hypothetical protein
MVTQKNSAAGFCPPSDAVLKHNVSETSFRLEVTGASKSTYSGGVLINAPTHWSGFRNVVLEFYI